LAFLSQRIRIARHFESHASIRSTTHLRGLWAFGRGGRSSRMSDDQCRPVINRSPHSVVRPDLIAFDGGGHGDAGFAGPLSKRTRPTQGMIGIGPPNRPSTRRRPRRLLRQLRCEVPSASTGGTVEREEEVLDRQDFDIAEAGIQCVAAEGVRTHHRASTGRWLVDQASR
jgi:hypothetical protein